MDNSILKHYFQAIINSLAFLLLGLQACVTDEVYLDMPLSAETLAVRFSSSDSGIPTRTNSSDNTWVEGDSIGIYMLLESDNNIANSIADNRAYYATTVDNNQIAFVAGDRQQIFYPSTEERVNFIAYYPYKPTGNNPGNICNYIYPIDVSKQQNLAAIDVLYGKSESPQMPSYSPIDLTFRHLLTKIIIYITAEEGVVLHGMKSLINGMPLKAQLDLNTGIVAAASENKAFDIFGAGRPPVGIADNDTTFEAIVIPHTVDNSLDPHSETIQFFSSEQKQYTWIIPDMELKSGSVYIFKLRFESDGPADLQTRSQMIITDLKQEPWTN
ncbi:MAG: fimbrillin family protein [Tannerellaceae bacterium]|jgi:hypothetical protein|nr:fimbrillin family protein [Tannerellaceae bacterium]